MEDLHGRLLDADSHLQLPPSRLAEAFGDTFADLFLARFGAGRRTRLERMEAMSGPPAEPDPDNVWTIKMWQAPGAFDADIRLRTLDCMGVDRQLLFPMAVPAAMMLSRHPEAQTVARRYNDFALDWASGSGHRLRPVAVINMVDRDQAMEETRRVLNRGASSVNIGCGLPPGGLSPADPLWEPFWSMLAEASIPVLLHIGGETGFVDKAWGNTINLLPGHRTDPLDGESVGPFNLSVMPFAPQAFLTAMILDGVLDRHPDLHIGVIEMTAQWVGPFAEMLDQRLLVMSRLRELLSLRPSEYLARQVRVTPFWWEPVGVYINRYGLEDVYVFSTDFPHVEGGTEPRQRFAASLAGHSEAVREKFFATNAALIV